MKRYSFEIDYTFCPEGHGSWTFIGSSILYSDIFYCTDCDCFYVPSLRKIVRGEINKDYTSDREADLIRLANFKRWKSKLTIEDYDRQSTTHNQ